MSPKVERRVGGGGREGGRKGGREGGREKEKQRNEERKIDVGGDRLT